MFNYLYELKNTTFCVWSWRNARAYNPGYNTHSTFRFDDVSHPGYGVYIIYALPNAWDRRLLHSAASSPVLNTVRGVTSTKSSVHLAPISAVYAFRAVEKLSTLRQKIKKEKTLRELVERAGKAKGCSLRRPIGNY